MTQFRLFVLGLEFIRLITIIFAYYYTYKGSWKEQQYCFLKLENLKVLASFLKNTEHVLNLKYNSVLFQKLDCSSIFSKWHSNYQNWYRNQKFLKWCGYILASSLPHLFTLSMNAKLILLVCHLCHPWFCSFNRAR